MRAQRYIDTLINRILIGDVVILENIDDFLEELLTPIDFVGSWNYLFLISTMSPASRIVNKTNRKWLPVNILDMKFESLKWSTDCVKVSPQPLSTMLSH